MKRIAVIPNQSKDIDLKITRFLIECLSEKAEIYMDKIYEKMSGEVKYTEDIYTFADAVIILGGDGTILQAAEPCARLNIPIMGINLGKIGFMTEIEVEDIEKSVQRLLKDDYEIEKRMMMKVDIIKKDGTTSSYYALNDAVISKPDAQMISLELYREDEKINEYIADGVIVSTPTGSTGYSLSAGGPVADPAMEMFISTPICAHMLSSRTAILPANKKISVRLTEVGNKSAVVTIDGQIKDNISCGEHIEVRRWEEKVRLIKMGNQSFYDILTKKLS